MNSTGNDVAVTTPEQHEATTADTSKRITVDHQQFKALIRLTVPATPEVPPQAWRQVIY